MLLVGLHWVKRLWCTLNGVGKVKEPQARTKSVEMSLDKNVYFLHHQLNDRFPLPSSNVVCSNTRKTEYVLAVRQELC